MTGLTYSTDFPVLNALQTTYGGAGDAFFSKINTDGSGPAPGPLLYSTYLGGNNLDQGNGIAIDATGIAYITGIAGTGALPFSTDSLCGNGVTTGPCGGTADAFVAKMDATKSGASSLLYFTYFGGSFAEAGNGIAVDTAGNAYITGSTVSTDFPTTAAVFQSQYGGGNADAFVTEIEPLGFNPGVLILFGWHEHGYWLRYRCGPHSRRHDIVYYRCGVRRRPDMLPGFSARESASACAGRQLRCLRFKS